MTTECCDFHFPPIKPATTLNEVWEVFEPTLAIDPQSEFYIHRTDPKLRKLTSLLQNEPLPRFVVILEQVGIHNSLIFHMLDSR